MGGCNKVAHPEIVLGVRLGNSVRHYMDKAKSAANIYEVEYCRGKIDAYQNCLDWVRELFDTKSSKSSDEG